MRLLTSNSAVLVGRKPYLPSTPDTGQNTMDQAQNEPDPSTASTYAKNENDSHPLPVPQAPEGVAPADKISAFTPVIPITHSDPDSAELANLPTV